MGALVYSDVIIASYQGCMSDIKGQLVGKFYIYWCNWRSLNDGVPISGYTHP